MIVLSQLRGLPGAPALEDAWLAARAGEHGYLAGKDAEAIACGALIVPVVADTAGWAVIGQMITLVLDAFTHRAPHPDAGPADPGPAPAAVSQPAPLPPEAWRALQYAMEPLLGET